MGSEFSVSKFFCLNQEDNAPMPQKSKNYSSPLGEAGGTEFHLENLSRNMGSFNWWKHQNGSNRCFLLVCHPGVEVSTCSQGDREVVGRKAEVCPPHHPDLVGEVPLLSCQTLSLQRWPRLSMSRKLNVSVLFRSNLFQLADCFRARVPLSPFSPKMMMNTLASVPAPGSEQDGGSGCGPLQHTALLLWSVSWHPWRSQVCRWASSESTRLGWGWKGLELSGLLLYPSFISVFWAKHMLVG